VLTPSAPATGTITVNYHTEAGRRSADFTSQSGTVTFAAGEQSKTISIAIIRHADELNETFNVVRLTPAALSQPRHWRPPSSTTTWRIAGSGCGQRHCHGRQQRHQRSRHVTLLAVSTASVTAAYATTTAARPGSSYRRQRHAHLAAGDLEGRTSPYRVTPRPRATRRLRSRSSPNGVPSPTAPPPAPSPRRHAPPPPAGDLARHPDRLWSSFNGNVVVHNNGSSTRQQIVPPNQITDI
jgi:hypothetical protein